ncbi:hypothetical protein V5N11_002913 [Cardamine amara subsp. amara]|uniref:Uncharacterized protein n=1 Tax=Cardamine amara subsp. amara TaxID=228776 RepID=A0ABD1BBG1_CARAN
MGDLQLRLHFVDSVKMIPILKKYMKDILTNKQMLEKRNIVLTHEVNAIFLNKVPKKQDDPGSFTLPCDIEGKKFERCLCDPCKISLILADRSIRHSEGLLENVHVQIGECLILTDFIVLKLEEEPRDPIILGRPFLATAGAIINVHKWITNLHLSDLVMRFDLDKMTKNR